MNFEASFNQQICSGNNKHNHTYKLHTYLRGNPPQREEEKPLLDQPVHANFTMSNQGTESSRTSRDYNTLQLATNRQQQQPQETRLQQSRDITISVPLDNQQTALKP